MASSRRSWRKWRKQTFLTFFLYKDSSVIPPRGRCWNWCAGSESQDSGGDLDSSFVILKSQLHFSTATFLGQRLNNMYFSPLTWLNQAVVRWEKKIKKNLYKGNNLSSASEIMQLQSPSSTALNSHERLLERNCTIITAKKIFRSKRKSYWEQNHSQYINIYSNNNNWNPEK